MRVTFSKTVILAAIYTWLVLILALSLATEVNAAQRSGYRFGQDNKWSSLSLQVGASVISGSRKGIGANTFLAPTDASALYSRPRHLAFEYAEHTSRTTLGFGLEYTQIDVSTDLRTALGITTGANLSLSYFDIPITYRLGAFGGGKSALNFSVGLALIPMLDIAVSSEAVFESGSGGVTGETGTLSNKHLDFGFGVGGEVDVEQRISTNAFLTARVGFRQAFTGVTRPNFGFFLAGIRIYQH